MTNESDITSIRIPKSVKHELSKVALDKESYHITIQRLIKENHQLRKTNERCDDLINLYKEMNMGLDELSTFAKKVCAEYLNNPDYCPTLFSYKEINKIVFSENSFEDKIERLKEIFNSNGDAFMCALDYCALHQLNEDINLFNVFLREMYKNNPYDENNYYEWESWNNRFSKQYKI